MSKIETASSLTHASPRVELGLDADMVWSLQGKLDAHGPLREFCIYKTPVRIGRRSDCALCLASETVSSRHAEIVAHDGTLWVRDLGSTNGTYVNGAKVEGEVPLRDGDLVQFAMCTFRVRHYRRPSQTCTLFEDSCDRALAVIQLEKMMSQRAVQPMFQAVVDLADGKTLGYEVLGRGKLFGLQSPQAMFSAAAELKVEAELSRLLRYEGVRRGICIPHQPNLFVNTHPEELDDFELLVTSLHEIRALAPQHPLTLEIHEASVTEPAAMRRLRDVLGELKMQLAYDDFGAGQARLAELIEVPPDYLKFDMKLVQGISTAPAHRREIVEGFVSLVRRQGVRTLAEGIETQADADVCRQLGFDLVQGFHFGRPVLVRDLLQKSAERGPGATTMPPPRSTCLPTDRAN